MYNEEILDYLGEKRDEALQARLMNLVNKSYDPTDPVQRRILDKVAPEFTRSRVTLVKKVLEQREFLMLMANASHFEDDLDQSLGNGAMSAGQKFQRLVRILGGAEALLEHPMDQAISQGNNSAGGLISGLFGNATRGLFALSSFSTNLSGVTYNPSVSRAQRETIAENLLHLFPSYMLGRNNATGTAAFRDSQGGAVGLVAQCELICDKNQTISDVYERFRNGGASNASWIR